MVGRDDAKPVVDLGIDDDDQGEREQAIDKEVAVGQVQLQHYIYFQYYNMFVFVYLHICWV